MNAQPQPFPGTSPTPQPALQLEDIHLPPEPGFWPPAPGWWLVGALLLIAIFFGVRALLRWREKRREQQRIEATLARLKQALDGNDPQQAIIDINVFLRKMALTHFPASEVASLTGRDWLEFLDRSGHTGAFTRGAGAVLAEGPYRAGLPDNFDRDALWRAIDGWVRTVTKKEEKTSGKTLSQPQESPA